MLRETPKEDKDLEDDFKEFLEKGITNLVREGKGVLENQKLVKLGTLSQQGGWGSERSSICPNSYSDFLFKKKMNQNILKHLINEIYTSQKIGTF